jgi:succinate dehydrogenase / fumarate reductase cytochrome b subunit
VFHFANGLWTMGITWGVWTSPLAQKRALRVCMTFGVLLAAVTVGALYGMVKSGNGAGLEKAIAVEDRMYKAKVETGEIEPNVHKRAVPETATSAESN